MARNPAGQLGFGLVGRIASITGDATYDTIAIYEAAHERRQELLCLAARKAPQPVSCAMGIPTRPRFTAGCPETVFGSAAHD